MKQLGNEAQEQSGNHASGTEQRDCMASMRHLRSALSPSTFERVQTALMWLNCDYGVALNSFGYLLALMITKELIPAPLDDGWCPAGDRYSSQASVHDHDVLNTEITRMKSLFDQSAIEAQLENIFPAYHKTG